MRSEEYIDFFPSDSSKVYEFLFSERNMKRDFKASFKKHDLNVRKNTPNSFFANNKIKNVKFNLFIATWVWNSASNMPFLSTSDWLQLVIHIHDQKCRILVKPSNYLASKDA